MKHLLRLVGIERGNKLLRSVVNVECDQIRQIFNSSGYFKKTSDIIVNIHLKQRVRWKHQLI